MIKSDSKIFSFLRTSSFKKEERYIFLLATLVNALPILIFKFFPTGDGPAHLYNSNLIGQLITGNNFLHQFFFFNSEPIPNWTGHLFLTIVNLFLPAYLAEKLLLLFYFFGLPLAFRQLTKTISPNNYFLSYLIFPFTYSFSFYLGFYNFCLGIVFLFMAINYWLRHNYKMNFKKGIVLFLLITATYFSHLFVFVILILAIGLHILMVAFIAFLEKGNSYKSILQNMITQSVILLVCSFVVLILCASYFYFRPPFGGEKVFLPTQQLIEWIINIRPKIALSFSKEERYTKPLFYLIFFLVFASFFYKLKGIKVESSLSFSDKFKAFTKQFFLVSDFVFYATIVLLILYFKLPDTDNAAGYITIRIGLLFFLFLILWLSTQVFPNWIIVTSIVVIAFFNGAFLLYYIESAEDLNKVAKECNNASAYIEPNSVVAPIKISEHWLQGHYSNYLGIDKPMVILDNYEGLLDWFPLRWKPEHYPMMVFSGTQPNEFMEKLNQFHSKIDYVFILGKLESRTDSNSVSLTIFLKEYYKLKYCTESATLYGRK